MVKLPKMADLLFSVHPPHFDYTLFTRLTFLYTCPRPQIIIVVALNLSISTMIAYQRGSEECVPLTDYYFPNNQ